MINLIGFTGAVLCLLLGWQFPWSKTPLIMGLCYGLASLGVSIMMRAGQVSFGHALYAAIGAYTVAFMARAYPGMDGMLMLFFAVIVSAAAGALVGVFVVRYRGIFFGMLNLALSMVVYAMLGKMYDISGGTDGLRLDRPAMLGSVLERAYVFSALLVGLSGGLFALVQGLVTPDIGAWFRSGEYVFIAVLGGSGHAMGAFLGAVVFEVVKLFAAAYMTGIWQMLLGLTLIFVIILAPDGIVGLLRKRRAVDAGEQA